MSVALPFRCTTCGTVETAGFGGPVTWLRVSGHGYPADYYCPACTPVQQLRLL
jgi:hypothetical protein